MMNIGSERRAPRDESKFVMLDLTCIYNLPCLKTELKGNDRLEKERKEEKKKFKKNVGKKGKLSLCNRLKFLLLLHLDF